MVDPLAAWWGPHTVWKIILAAILLLVMPAGALLVSRLLGRSWRNGEACSNQEFNLHRSMWLLVFLPFMLLYAISVIMVILSFIDWPAYPTGEHMRWAIEVLGYDWIEIHPTPAIHHTYATVSLLGVTLIYVSGLIVARSAANRLASFVGSSERAMLLSFLTNAAGSVLAWFS
ncbi:hypothetical protein ACFLSW_00765 [Candidatus Bipolaricaulota bacterium]